MKAWGNTEAELIYSTFSWPLKTHFSFSHINHFTLSFEM